MIPKHRTINWLPFLVLLVYTAVLTKNIVFKRNSVQYYKTYFKNDYQHYSVHTGWQHANKVPFRTINLFYKSYQRNSATAAYNLWGNLLGFIPFGILFPLALPWFRQGLKTFAAVFFLSLGFETFQLYTGLGVFDVDDLLLNTVGGVLGYFLFWIDSRVRKRGSGSTDSERQRPTVTNDSVY